MRRDHARPAQMSIFLRALLLVGIFFAAGIFGARADWRWQLTPGQYKKLNQYERAQYQKAEEHFKNQNYKAAASEFEKFKVQFPDSSQLPYMVFMRGLSLHRAKQRNTAIKIYQEVLDRFGDPDVLAPAIYFMGEAFIENGDYKNGFLAMEEFVNAPSINQHPLAAGALIRLAQNYWKRKEYDKAIAYYKQVVRDFSEKARRDANKARDAVTGYYVRKGDYAGYENWIVNPEKRQNAEHRYWVAQNAWNTAYNGFRHRWRDIYTRYNQEEKKKDMLAFHNWFKQQKRWYDEQKRTWYWFDRALHFVVYDLKEDKERDAVVDSALKYIKETWKDNKDELNKKYAWVCERLRDAQEYEQARICIAMMTDPALAAWKEYEILSREHKWKAVEAKLKEVINGGQKEWTRRAEKSLAYHYLYHMAKYDEAIKLYNMIDERPEVNWHIAEAYRRKGDLKNAINALSEIENFFPDHASRASKRKAEIYLEAGDKKKAIAVLRRILKVYKDSREASWAHERLEELGIAVTGGARE